MEEEKYSSLSKLSVRVQDFFFFFIVSTAFISLSLHEGVSLASCGYIPKNSNKENRGSISVLSFNWVLLDSICASANNLTYIFWQHEGA